VINNKSSREKINRKIALRRGSFARRRNKLSEPDLRFPEIYTDSFVYIACMAIYQNVE